MKWAKTTHYRTSIIVQEKLFDVKVEMDDDNNSVVYVNREYAGETNGLPSQEELVEIISEIIELDEITSVSYPEQHKTFR